MSDESKYVFEKIDKNYRHLNHMMIEEMDIASLHGGITGDYREQMWISLFRNIIPKKFSMAQGVMIIDSNGNISKEVDIAIYDEAYTPYVFQYNTLKFIPIEAVAVVIECKSTSLKEKELNDWVEKIDNLKPNASGIARIVTGYVCGITNKSQLKTRPIKILATIRNSKTEALPKNMGEKYGDKFDFIIIENADDKKNEFQLIVENKKKSFGWWAKELNGVGEEGNLEIEFLSISKQKSPELKGDNKEHFKMNEELELFDNERRLKKTLEDLEIKGNTFLSLNFQLNQLLMLINNPMLFPHFAYAKKFNEIIKNMEKEKKS